MAVSFEELLIAIAVKNGIIPHEAGVEFLKAFDAQPLDKPARPIVELMIEAKKITLDQAAALHNATKKVVVKVMSGQFAVPNAPAAAPAQQAPTARAVVAPASTNPNEPIPGYKMSRKIGVGGTATVFLAEDKKHGNRPVALKILQPARAKDEKALRAFLREADLLVKFKHPNLCGGYEFGQAGQLAYMALEYIDGESVLDIIEKQGPLQETRALEVILETAKALDYIQAQGVVHRDIKPANIMITKAGAVKVLDLGFAIELNQAGGADVEEETTSGTVQYMAPEQARGASVDVRADIYALGASLFHMIMGEVPFKGSDSLEVMQKQVLEALNSSEIKNRRISRHMHYFIERMMSKDKTLRYANPKELIDDINEQIEGFRSLEFKPTEDTRKSTTILRNLSQSGPEQKPNTTRRFTTRRFQRPE
jgi:serine/threonine-protein kinase